MFAIRSSRLPPVPGLAPVVRRFVVIVGVIAVSLLPAAQAADKLTTADRQAIEQTIRSQLDAFGRDDAERAFGLATPDIQRMFGSSDSFMAMVRDHYEPVYHPASFRFMRAEMIDGEWTQPVQITDSGGRVWRAQFTMRRQPDKTWKVGGCQLVETRAIEA